MENDSMQWYALTGVLNVSPCGSSQLSEAYEKTGRSLFFSFAFASCGGGGGANINGTFICHIRRVECGRERMRYVAYKLNKSLYSMVREKDVLNFQFNFSRVFRKQIKQLSVYYSVVY